MPYTRRQYQNRRTFQRWKRGGFQNRNRRKNFDYWDVMNKVKADVTKLKGLLNTEFKALDIASSATITTTPSILMLSGLAKGDDFDNRDGRQVRWKSVEVSMQVVMHTTPINTLLRVMVVIDKQPNATLLTIAELLVQTTIDSLKNLDNRKRLVILRDDVIELSDGKGTSLLWKYYKKIDMITVYDDGDAGTIADIETNALYLIMFSSEATNGPTVQRFIRTRFIDN